MTKLYHNSRVRASASASVWAICLLAGWSVTLADETPSHRGEPSAKVGTRRALIVCGLPGDDEHRKLFAETIEKLYKALTEKYGFSAPEVLVRFGVESQPGDGPALAKAKGLSNREGIAAAVAELRKRLVPEDTLWVIVLGHAHYDGRHSHLNLPGPDLDERAFAKLFEGLKARAGLLHHNARERLLPQATRRDRPNHDHGDRGRPGGQ